MKIAFFDTKPYDRSGFDALLPPYERELGFTLYYFENKLNKDTAFMAAGCEAAVAFVNDTVDEEVIRQLVAGGTKILALRCAGYNNVDFRAAFQKLHVVRVPAYSPYAVAEHAMALCLSLVRKIHRAYLRTRDYNFSIAGLTGFDLHGKTAGVVGTGRIGRIFIDICRGFGMQVLAYDPYPDPQAGYTYVPFLELCEKSDIISLHCPLTEQTRHMVNREALSRMKQTAVLINTSRGALIESEALLEALKAQAIGGACLDVYEEESELFYEDFSNTVVQDDILARLCSLPNVLLTSHQAFLTKEALQNIASTTLNSLAEFASGKPLTNEICYQCPQLGHCKKEDKGRCF